MILDWTKENGFVYMLFDKETLLYVGFTTDPVRRLSAHLSTKAKNSPLSEETKKRVTTIRLTHAGKEKDGICLEASMIATLHPECNKQNDNWAAWMEDEYHECDFYWCEFKKAEFDKDKSVVFRCFRQEEAYKAKQELSKQKAIADELEIELIKAREDNELQKHKIERSAFFENQSKYWEEVARLANKNSIAAYKELSRWQEDYCSIKRDLDQIPGIVQFFFGLKSAIRMVGCK